jgi:hypothetical protein
MTKAKVKKVANKNTAVRPALIDKEIRDFDAGFKAGVKAQQEWYADHPWWQFWA